MLLRRCLSSSYPGRPHGRTSIPAFVSSFSPLLTPGQRLLPAESSSPSAEPVILCGRIVSKIRKFAKDSLVFFHIESEGGRVQVLADKSLSGAGDFASQHDKLERGDVIQVSGFPGKTKTGELSLLTTHTVLLAPCVRDLAMGRGDGKFAVSDVGFLQKHREVQLLVGGEEARQVFERRYLMLRSIRNYLHDNQFIEVETPVLSKTVGGAFAKPFQTTTKNLTLRISPELALKRLIVGGYDRVFEIGKVFRDEGLSVRHNPEFTSIELYQTYANSRDLHAMTKEILQHCFDAAGGGKNQEGRRVTPQGVDFDCEFREISIADELEKFGTFSFSQPGSVTPAKLLALLSAKTKATIADNELGSIPRLLDKLIGQEVESKLDPKVPTFLIDHPTLLSPLAKERGDRPGVVERFELFAGNFELCNAYSELNDPAEQRERFTQQASWRMGGDEECQLPDEEFCEALEYGMPPTAGWGLGVDRLVMLLLGKTTIRDVILFPQTS